MQLYTPNQIEEQRELVNRYAHQMLQPRHDIAVDGDIITLCWIARLNRAQEKTKDAGELGAKAMQALTAQWQALCSTADKEYKAYIAMCPATNQPAQTKFIVPTCDCPGCIGSWEGNHNA